VLVEHAPAASGIRIPKRVWIPMMVVGAAIMAGALLLASHWPFTRESIAQALGKASGTEVRIGAFRKTFSPPGCIAERLEFFRSGSGKPLITVARLTVRTTYLGLFTFPKRISEVKAQGMRLVVPPKGSTGGGGAPIELGGNGKPLVIGRIVADGAVLEFPRRDSREKPYVLAVQRLSLADVGGGVPMRYRAAIHISEPPGMVSSEGRFGPWSADHPGGTRVSGTFTYSDADLAPLGGVAGILQSRGDFEGTLARIETRGAIDVPDFRVKAAGHPVHLHTTFHAVVDATNGDVFLEPAQSRFLATGITARGGITGPGGKTARLALSVPRGQVDDLLRLFVSGPPDMFGPAALTVNAVWPPGSQPFLEKIRLDGDFDLPSSHFAPGGLQQGVNGLSESAEGEHKKERKLDTRTMLSRLRGHVSVRNGIAIFSRASFAAPGIRATLHGTYNLLDQGIDLRGTLYTRGSLSASTSGVKALLAKVVSPLFRRGSALKAVPFKITGRNGESSISIDWKR
jgi:hypothetical protein